LCGILIYDQGGKAEQKMSKQTHTNPFSKREMEILKGNPYVASVSAHTIRFTPEFKNLVYEEKAKGIPIAEAMRKYGIDPDVLGYSRVKGFSCSLNKKARLENGFEDGRGENYRRPVKTGTETVEQRVKRLEHELAYTRQEVEFLKKMQAANLEAQKQWEFKHQQR
jgi:transposase-like protein